MIGSVISNFESVFIFIVVLSILIIVHEWGHFITAKKLGVEVQRFALGFGPTLYSRKYNGTTYMINAIPLGGYVKMAGDERSECLGKPAEFYSKPIGHRSLIVLNGPVVNFLLAYLSFILVFMIGYPGQSTVVADVDPEGPAYTAGVRPGDKIVALDSKDVYGWLNLESRLEGNRSTDMKVTVLRDGQKITFDVLPNVVTKPNMVGRPRLVRDLGVSNLPNVIGGVVEDYPAKQAGLLPGDQIISIDSKEIKSWKSLQNAIVTSKGKEITVRFQRDGKVMALAITPKMEETKDESGAVVQKRKLGIGPQQELELYRFSVFPSFEYAWDELVFITQLTYESLFRMLTGAMSARESVTGPVGIFYIVKGAAEAGLSHLIFILGVISASLAIFNLLPVIPLDGGHLFLFALEKARGRALSPKVDEYIARVGFSLIILLAIFVFYSDFARFGWFDGINHWFQE